MATLVYDNLDDRKEVWHLLHRMPPAWRVSWLGWCCRQVAGRYGPVRPKQAVYGAYVTSAKRGDRGDEYLTNEIFIDWWRLGHQYQLDMDTTAKRLVEMVRRKGW